MKKRRKLDLKKVMIAKIDNPNRIKVMGGVRDATNPDGNCKSPSDSIPSDTGNAGSEIILCALDGTTGDVCK
ncbi:hypothetical protein GTQ40_15820 [Flavobacteriaceae bacterium R38]|nr:hypothetical protein [Flavobacteriaceae bacterium R38]